MDAKERIRQGDLAGAYEALREAIRRRPESGAERVFLFQLLTVVGQWDRAITQLNVAADLEPKYLVLAQVCRALLNSEAFRAEVFAGRRSPLLFGEPGAWVGRLLQACQLVAEEKYEAAAGLRDSAFEEAEAVPGRINGTDDFAWIADMDTRLGPLMEVVIEGRYYWVPMSTVSLIKFEEPQDLRDTVWMPVEIVWRNEGQSVGFVPTRYPGSEGSEDPAIQLARKTEWEEKPHGHYLGLGQRMLATDAAEYPLMDLREITFHHPQSGNDEAEKGGPDAAAAEKGE